MAASDQSKVVDKNGETVEPAKILLVDDRHENLLSLESILRGPDRLIFKAQSGKEALGLLMEHSFAVALIDVQMPEMNGFELAELMRGSEDTQSIPILFVAATGPDHALHFQGFEAGAVDILYKPLNESIVRSKVGVFVDIDKQRTLLKQKVDELQAAQDRIKASNLELERFAHVASHDMKEPLRTIILHLSLLKKEMGDRLTTRAGDSISFAVEGSKRLASLIDSLTSYSRFGSSGLKLADVDCSAILRDVAQDLSIPLKEKNATLDIGFLPTIRADKEQLRQVFQNLISNALKFSRANPVIAVSAQREEGKHIFSVTDNGIGIAETHIGRIFEPFFRAHPRNQFDGSGIGLSVCKTIVEKHGGKIWVESQVGSGTTFMFTLPDQPEAAS